MENLLKQRNLPPLKSREEMLDILLREQYGYLPEKPRKVTFSAAYIEKKFRMTSNFCEGKATYKRIMITSETENGSFSFPVSVVIPTEKGPHPFFVHINFRPDVPDIYMPTEEIIDSGFAVISFCYEDITMDDNRFDTGLAALLYPDGNRKKATDCGKLAMWAWAVHRAMDYAMTEDALDKECAIVCGHSRLGKTALLAAATDERFTFAYANGAGCSGSCITRQKRGERVADICRNFPHWFCENYKKYAGKEEDMPFDQHYLLALIAPRYVAVGSDNDGPLSDTVADMLACIGAGKAYEDMGKTGFVYDGNEPQEACVWHEGRVGFHMRKGPHYFGRYDWNMIMSFVKRHKGEII